LCILPCKRLPVELGKLRHVAIRMAPCLLSSVKNRTCLFCTSLQNWYLIANSYNLKRMWKGQNKQGMLVCEHRIYELMSVGIYIIDPFYNYRCLCYRYILYKHLQMIVGTYLQLSSRLIGSCFDIHILALLRISLSSF